MSIQKTLSAYEYITQLYDASWHRHFNLSSLMSRISSTQVTRLA